MDRNIFSLLLVLIFLVALRKESVDRNGNAKRYKAIIDGRSPQGERG